MMPCFRENCHSIFFWGVRKGWGGVVGAGVWLGRVLKTILYRAHIFLTVISDVLFTKERESVFTTQTNRIDTNVMNLICFINRTWFCYLMRKCVNVIKIQIKKWTKKWKVHTYICVHVYVLIYMIVIKSSLVIVIIE